MKKVTSIVLNNFQNDSRVLKENISLQKAGYKVCVVALHEKSLKEFDKVENILVHRVKLNSRNWSKSKLIQVIKYFEFIYRVSRKYRDSDILHCNDLSTLPIGVIIKKFFNKNAKIVYDAHEYETEINGLTPTQKYVMRKMEKFFIKHVNVTITVSDAIANEYVRLYDIVKPKLVLNTPHYKDIEENNIFREKLDIGKEKIIFLYQGGLSKGRGIEILLDTFKNIRDDRVVIVFMGYGSLQQLVQEVSKRNKNIYYHKAVSPDILLNHTHSADFGILFYENNCLNHYYCSPNKMFEYVMAEIPVIVSNLYEMKKLVEKCQVGIVAEKNTVEGLHEAIDKALKSDKKMLSKNIQRMKKLYNWEEQEKVLLQVYRELI